jgi:hypothetical protein
MVGYQCFGGPCCLRLHSEVAALRPTQPARLVTVSSLEWVRVQFQPVMVRRLLNKDEERTGD